MVGNIPQSIRFEWGISVINRPFLGVSLFLETPICYIQHAMIVLLNMTLLEFLAIDYLSAGIWLAISKYHKQRTCHEVGCGEWRRQQIADLKMLADSAGIVATRPFFL